MPYQWDGNINCSECGVRYTMSMDTKGKIRLLYHDNTVPNTEGRVFQVSYRFRHSERHIEYIRGEFPSATIEEDGVCSRWVFKRRNGKRERVAMEEVPMLKVTYEVKPKNWTHGCDHMDKEGWCMGHHYDREDFIRIFCGGVEPPVVNTSHISHWLAEQGVNFKRRGKRQGLIYWDDMVMTEEEKQERIKRKKLKRKAKDLREEVIKVGKSEGKEGS